MMIVFSLIALWVAAIWMRDCGFQTDEAHR
jgi:hypothetical protein